MGPTIREVVLDMFVAEGATFTAKEVHEAMLGTDGSPVKYQSVVNKLGDMVRSGEVSRVSHGVYGAYEETVPTRSANPLYVHLYDVMADGGVYHRRSPELMEAALEWDNGKGRKEWQLLDRIQTELGFAANDGIMEKIPGGAKGQMGYRFTV